MALAYDASSQGDGAAVTSLTVPHTIGSGSNRLLLVGVNVFHAGGGGVPTLTYNGTTMTAAVASGIGVAGIVHIFYLKESGLPSAGTYNIVVTPADPGTSDLALCGDSLTGVDQTTPIPHTASGTGSSTTPSTACTSSAGNWVYDAVSWFNTTKTGQGAGQTPRTINENGAVVESVDTSTADGAASVTMSWTLAASRAWRQVVVDIAAAAGGGGSDPFVPIDFPNPRRGASPNVGFIDQNNAALITALNNGAPFFTSIDGKIIR